MLCHVPGLKVVMPSTPHDMKGLLVACVRDDNPTIVVKHKTHARASRARCPRSSTRCPLGVGRDHPPRHRRHPRRLQPHGRSRRSAAAEQLAGEGIDCEVIDLRTVAPLDIETVVASARKTNRVVVVHEAVRFGGLGAEIAAQIQEHAFDHLDAPVARVGAPFSPIPFSPALESAYVPDAERIAAEIRGDAPPAALPARPA